MREPGDLVTAVTVHATGSFPLALHPTFNTDSRRLSGGWDNKVVEGVPCIVISTSPREFFNYNDAHYVLSPTGVGWSWSRHLSESILRLYE